MKNFDPLSDTILNYVKGQLGTKELHNFTEQLNADSELREEVAFQRLVMDSLASMNNDQLRTHIQTSIHQIDSASDQTTSISNTELQTSRKKKVFSLKKQWLSIAASLLFLICLGGLWYINDNFSDQSLADANHKLPSPSFQFKGDQSSSNKDIFKQVSAAYSSKDYPKAIELLSSVTPSPEYNKARFHLGNLYLETDQATNAISVFEDLLTKNDIRYQEEVQWLVAVAYLQNNEPDQSRKALRPILKDPAHSFYKQAVTLAKNLNSPLRIFVF